MSTIGNNGNNCSTPGTPCATINGAVGKASPGDTIYVTTGVFYGIGAEVAALTKNVAVSGGWDATFAQQVGQTVLDGQGDRRGLAVSVGVTATAERLTVQRGLSLNNLLAGGVNNAGTFTLSAGVIQFNHSNGAGGLYNSGTLTLINSQVSQNTGRCGGGLRNEGGHLIIETSRIYSNTTTDGADGGGICSNLPANASCPSLTAGGFCPETTLVISASAVFSNVALGSGGGLALNHTAAVLNNTTISDNRAADYGGGIDIEKGTTALNNVTIADNISGERGNGLYHSCCEAAEVVLRNSVVTNNRTLYSNVISNCAGLSVSGGYNVLQTGCAGEPGPGDISGVEVRLAPLEWAGGFHALLPNSPAINAGDPAGCRDQAGVSLDRDQRGAPRAGRCDAGAYELLWWLNKTVSGGDWPGTVATYEIGLTSLETFTEVVVSDVLPTALTYVPDTLSASAGSTLVSGNGITWTGTLTGGVPTTITFQALSNPEIGQVIVNTALASWQGVTSTASARLDTNTAVFMPMTVQRYCPDDFTDNFTRVGDWPHGDSAELYAGVTNNEYQVISKQPFLFLLRAPTCTRLRYSVEADMHWGSVNGSAIGLLFGLNNDFTEYHFLSLNTATAYYTIYWRHPDGSLTVAWVPTYAPQIRVGSQDNHVKVAIDGEHMRIEINGVLVSNALLQGDEVMDWPSATGLAMAPYSNVPVAEARFDNFKVLLLPEEPFNASAVTEQTGLTNGDVWYLPEYIPTFK